MRSVCYVIDMMVMTPEGNQPENVIIFGTVNEVTAHLQMLIDINKSLLLTDATHPHKPAIARARLQVLTTLLSHDLDALPVFPQVGTGQFQFKDAHLQVAFIGTIRVSIRGSKCDQEILGSPILLP